MKAILMSIRPQHMAKILNGKKTIEIRKKFPKDYVGWVYIYCTKDSKKGWCVVSYRKSQKHYYQPFSKNACYSPLDEYIGNGKVIPKKEWINDIVKCCDKADVKVFMKESLRQIMGDDFRQDELPWQTYVKNRRGREL